jgi:hypothetical protein
MSNKYKNGQIYKIICEDGCYYIGSTIQKLNHIFNSHKKSSKKVVCRVYDHINIIGWDKVQIELVENYSCNNKQELNKREQYYIDQSNDDLLCLNNEFEEIDDIVENDNIDIDISDNKSNSSSDSDNDSYQDGKIYKLVCKDGHYYIGSTTTSLIKRFSSHKYSIKNNTSGGKYAYFYSLPITDIHIELIENYPCNTNDELRKREDYYIQFSLSDKYCLNTFRAFQSEDDKKDSKRYYYTLNIDKIKENMKTYYEANKKTIIESHRDYNQENREKVDAYQAQYRLDNAEKRREYSKQYTKEHQEQVKETKKKYDEKNREKNTTYWKEYNNKEENKEKIQKYKEKWAKKYKEENIELIVKKRNEKRIIREEKKQERIKHDRTIIQCICGGSYQNYQKKRHEENKKHITFITNNQ